MKNYFGKASELDPLLLPWVPGSPRGSLGEMSSSLDPWAGSAQSYAGVDFGQTG